MLLVVDSNIVFKHIILESGEFFYDINKKFKSLLIELYKKFNIIMLSEFNVELKHKFKFILKDNNIPFDDIHFLRNGISYIESKILILNTYFLGQFSLFDKNDIIFVIDNDPSFKAYLSTHDIDCLRYI